MKTNQKRNHHPALNHLLLNCMFPESMLLCCAAPPDLSLVAFLGPEADWNIYAQLLFAMSWVHNANKTDYIFFFFKYYAPV